MWSPLHLINEYGIERADILAAALKKAGVEIWFGCEAEEIIMENGCVAGVRAHTKQGEPVEVRTSAVFIATGGFGNNKDMIKEQFQGCLLYTSRCV